MIVLNPKPMYALCRNLAYDVLLKQPSLSLIIDARTLALPDNIKFCTFERYSELTDVSEESLDFGGALSDGYTIKYGEGQYLILYHDDDPIIKGYPRQNRSRLRWTLAHELGHALLNHEADGLIQEAEANCFASQLLCPDCICERMVFNFDVIDLEEVKEHFGLSKEAAIIKLKQLKRKIEAVGYSCGRKELELVKKYSPSAYWVKKNWGKKQAQGLSEKADALRGEKLREIYEQNARVFSRLEEKYLYGRG